MGRFSAALSLHVSTRPFGRSLHSRNRLLITLNTQIHFVLPVVFFLKKTYQDIRKYLQCT